jgi:DNA (cytosine-5)-methyltransferase 1
VNGLSLFANVGIGETYTHLHGLDIKVANELLEDRASFYRKMHPNTEMICGDIRDPQIKKQVIDKAIAEGCDFILATPPCQGMSLAGRKAIKDERNLLIVDAVEVIETVSPAFVIIENVPPALKTKIWVDGKVVLIPEFLKQRLGANYHINYAVLDAADYGTPQSRKRAIFLLSKKEYGEWQFPEKQERITVKEVIGCLPSLEAGHKSEIDFHVAKPHNERHIECMRHTPTGKSAFDNESYYPKRLDGKRVRGYTTTYKRMSWDKPAPTITMGNGSISSQNNVHPGRKNADGTYSDARVLTLKELFLLTGLPDDWAPPEDVTDNLVRKVIGECLLPRLVVALIKTMPKI